MIIKKIGTYLFAAMSLFLWMSISFADDRLRYYDEINPGNDFTLTDQNGEIFSLKENRGKITLLFFGYLSCPDVCPVTMSKISRVYSLLTSQETKNVQTVFISVDTSRDTPEKMKEYLEFFSMDAVGLVGDKQLVDKIVADYMAWYEKVMVTSSLGYLINHTSYIYLIDQKGRVRYLFRSGEAIKHMAETIRVVLNE